MCVYIVIQQIVMLSFPLSAILMIVLCVRNCSLEEAWSGIAYVLNPRWEELMNLKVIRNLLIYLINRNIKILIYVYIFNVHFKFPTIK